MHSTIADELKLRLLPVAMLLLTRSLQGRSSSPKNFF
jgi:hypothetical protein